MKYSHQVFIGFAAEDRYMIAEPIAYHLKNYGINTWYDRNKLLLGDNLKVKNLINGAGEAKYACMIISKHTSDSPCAMDELSIIHERFTNHDVTIFPILYELKPYEIPLSLQWIKQVMFKEVNRSSGTREICNHIACKISCDILSKFSLKCVQDIISLNPTFLLPSTKAILYSYLNIDHNNLNSRISLLYAAFLTIKQSIELPNDTIVYMVTKIYERLFSEIKLNLSIDYRELWLLENSICILINYYLANNTESRI